MKTVDINTRLIVELLKNFTKAKLDFISKTDPLDEV